MIVQKESETNYREKLKILPNLLSFGSALLLFFWLVEVGPKSECTCVQLEDLALDLKTYPVGVTGGMILGRERRCTETAISLCWLPPPCTETLALGLNSSTMVISRIDALGIDTFGWNGQGFRTCTCKKNRSVDMSSLENNPAKFGERRA